MYAADAFTSGGMQIDGHGFGANRQASTSAWNLKTEWQY